ncbi:helix-turn-helix transcriptional regulator [Lapillicoccus jejuensis]
MRMTQELDLDAVVRARVRGLRTARGWSLDALAARCHLSPSTLSRIETGRRRVALDQLVLIARALGTTLDALVEPVGDEDVVIRPTPTHQPGAVVWLLSRPGVTPGVTVAKTRLTGSPKHEPGVHPGREWFTVLSGEVRLQLGERVLAVQAGEAAEFSTLVPHLITPVDGPAELLSIFDHDGTRAHLPGTSAGTVSDQADPSSDDVNR